MRASKRRVGLRKVGGRSIRLLLAGLGGWIAVGSGCGRPERDADLVSHEVTLEDFEVWTAFQGGLDAVQSESVASSISQPTALLMLAPEGAMVRPGDVVAVFDTSSLEAELAVLERDAVLAETEKRTLTQAEIPLRRARLSAELREARDALAREGSVGERMEELAADGLISPGELAGYASRVEALRESVSGLETQIRIQEEVMFPAQTEQAQARLDSARRQLQLVSDQIAAARVTAARGGRVVYLPLHIGGDFRTVREGDTVFRNQEFMRISDMEQLVVRCDVPESRLSRVPAGAEVRAVPDAFPELRLEGQVLSISSVAVQPAGRPAHMKTFTVTMLLFDADPRLRTGMTVRARVLSERHSQRPVVPRAFVRFEGGMPYVFVRRVDAEDRVAVTLGSGNETHFMIVEGVEAGTVLVRPPAL